MAYVYRQCTPEAIPQEPRADMHYLNETGGVTKVIPSKVFAEVVLKNKKTVLTLSRTRLGYRSRPKKNYKDLKKQHFAVVVFQKMRHT